MKKEKVATLVAVLIIAILTAISIRAVGQEVLADSIIVYGGGSFQGNVSVYEATDTTHVLPWWQMEDSIGGGGLWTNNGTTDYLTTTSNNVAIGYTTSVYKLSVSGDTYSSSHIYTDGKFSLSNTSDWYENTSGHSEISGSSLNFDLMNIGKVSGDYNLIFGDRNAAAKTDPDYCLMVGEGNVPLAVGTVDNNLIIGSFNGATAVGDIRYNCIVGNTNLEDAASDIRYNDINGNQNLVNAVGDIDYNNVVGRFNGYGLTGTITSNCIVGVNIAYTATGNMTDCLLVGNAVARYAPTVNKTIGIGADSFGSSTVSLFNCIAIGTEAGENNSYTKVALFGVRSEATENSQVVIGSSFYTGGILLDTSVVVNGEHTTENSFGELYDPADVISTATTSYYTLTSYTAGLYNEATIDADSTIQVNQAGIYKIDFSMSFTHSTNNTTVHISVFNSTDNSEFTNIETERKIGTGGDLGSVSGTGLVQLDASDKISIRAKADNTGNLTVSHGNINIIRIK